MVTFKPMSGLVDIVRYDPTLTIFGHPEVYPPSEDSILFIESLDVMPGERVLEIGCGSGVVSIHCALNGCIVTAGDINPHAVDLAQKNAEANGASMDVFLTDVYSNIEGVFDTILFNLPYLPVEDEGLLAKAWSGGDDGLGPLPRLLDESDKVLAHDGRIVVVTSSLMDREATEDAMADWTVRSLGELPLFFEKLNVLELRHR